MDVMGLPAPSSPPNTSPVASSGKKSASGRRIQYQVKRAEDPDEVLDQTLVLGEEKESSEKCEAPQAEVAHPPSPSYEAGGFRPFELGSVAAL